MPPVDVAKDGRHRAGPPFTALVHQLPAPPNESCRGRDVERAGGVIRRELAERMPGRGAHVRRDALAHGRPHRRAMRQQRRLRVVRQRERLGRAVEAERAERLAERARPRAANDVARRGQRVGEVLAHPRLL